MPAAKKKAPLLALAAVLAAIVLFAAVVAIRNAEPALLPASGPWQPYSEKALADAKAAHQPVLIDFYADWCGPCHLMDKHIFQDPSFLAAAKGFVLLRADLTRSDDPPNRALRHQYGVSGLPTIIFLDRDGRERNELRVEGAYKDWAAFLDPFLLAMDLTKTGAPMPQRAPPPEKK